MAELDTAMERTLVSLLDEKKYTTLQDILTTMNPSDIAAVFEELDQMCIRDRYNKSKICKTASKGCRNQ